MKIIIDTNVDFEGRFKDLSISEIFFLKVCDQLDEGFNVKDVMNNLPYINLKEDSVYRILKKLNSSGFIKMPSNKNKFLYLIGDEDGSVLKIGISGNSDLRIKDIQVSNHKKLKLFFSIEGLAWMERQIHKRFKHLSISGEWFFYSDEIIQYFTLLANHYGKNNNQE